MKGKTLQRTSVPLNRTIHAHPKLNSSGGVFLRTDRRFQGRAAAVRQPEGQLPMTP
jgi:hypothetical protein